MAWESIRGGKRHTDARPQRTTRVSGALWLFRQLPCLLEERLLWPKKAWTVAAGRSLDAVRFPARGRPRADV